jgi:glucose/arabinose dehydrogenase
MPRPTRRQTLALGLSGIAGLALPRTAAAQDLAVSPVVDGLDEPWAVAFLPGWRFLITERGGRMTLHGDGAARRIGGLPGLAVAGQGGLLDVMVPRDHAASNVLWLSYAASVEGGACTALARARLEGDRLADLTVVHQGPGTSGGRHFGSRIVEAPDGTVFVTAGDRGAGPNAQEVTRPEGKVLAFAPDGQPRTADAFSGQDVVPGLWSYGHRNPQGACLDLDGNLWLCEHGARGGDEINRVEPGRNYGWPVITHGVDYDGSPIGEGRAKEGMEQPAFFWDPSIAPSGLTVCSGRMFPDWTGHFLTGSLNSDLIARVDPATWTETRIEAPQTARVRDVREAPDGSIWFLSVNTGTLWRMTPG